ncbi:uncharacterized protein LOC110026528 [Phalaenopsis equestris]|uniref:uncharacterized protein LOC110026528 n=1 Tax=Phalaenopsis equestris TaxID=78828 RepID=UPI0009E37F53|nr:uncharacterized protein LOC110026528 [Phalaenopsis equestris]
MADAMEKKGGGLLSEGGLAVISTWSVIRSPNLYACHRCGLGFPVNCSVERLKILDSLWRVVLLCHECFALVGSGQICSYCFSWFPELEKGLIDCNTCFRRVHRGCVYLHHRNFSDSLLDARSFVCVDCRPIPQLPREDLKKDGGSSSRRAFRVSFQDAAKGSAPILGKKAIGKGKAGENVGKKVIVGRGSSGLKRKAFDAVDMVKKPSCVNLTVPDEKMALQLHQTINGSKRIFRSSCPKDLSKFTVTRKEQLSHNSVASIIDSNSAARPCKIEASTENESILEGRGDSKSISTNITLYKQENGDLMKQVRACNEGFPENFSLDEMEGSLKFPDCANDGINACLALLRCHTFNTWLTNTRPLKKHRFNDYDGEESSKLQQKSIDSIGPNGLSKKYVGKSWDSGRIMQENSHSTLNDSLLSKQEKGDLMKLNIICNAPCSRDFSLQERLNSWLKSTTPVDKYRFGDFAEVESSKLQQKSIDVIVPGMLMKKYFRKHRDNGRITQGNSHSILINRPFFKPRNRVLMKQTRECNAGCVRDFFLKEDSLKHVDSADDVGNAGPALLTCYSLSACSNSSMALTKYGFGDCNGEGSSTLQRKSIDAITCRSMKKYFRKRWSSKRIMKGNSESVLVNSLLRKEEKEDLSTGCSGGFSLKDKASSLQFPDFTNDGSNAGFATLPCNSLNALLDSTIPTTNYSFCNGDGESLKEMSRKPIDTIVSANMKKYYRKRQGSKRVMQVNPQSISVNSPLVKRENGDLMRGCETSCPGDVSLKEEISVNFADSIDDSSNIDSGLLQFHGLNNCLNGSMPLIKHTFGDGDGERCSKLQRRSIDAIGSDGSLKKYFRRKLGS